MTLDPIVLSPSWGGVIDPHWLELEARGPGQTNTLVLAGGIGIISEGVLDTEGADESASSHIYIETGYQFADGDIVGQMDLVGSAQLASIVLEGSDDFTFEILDVAALVVPPEEIAALRIVGISGDDGSTTGDGAAPPVPGTAMLIVKISYTQNGIVSTFRFAYAAAARVHRVDPNRIVHGWNGDVIDATKG